MKVSVAEEAGAGEKLANEVVKEVCFHLPLPRALVLNCVPGRNSPIGLSRRLGAVLADNKSFPIIMCSDVTTGWCG